MGGDCQKVVRKNVKNENIALKKLLISIVFT